MTDATDNGMCDDTCGCVVETESAASIPVALSVSPGEPAVACTLPLGAMPDRIAEWQGVLGSAGDRSTTDARLRVAFDRELDVAKLAQLIAVEWECCSFFSFALTVDGRGIALEVGAPEDAAELVEAVFGKAE